MTGLETKLKEIGDHGAGVSGVCSRLPRLRPVRNESERQKPLKGPLHRGRPDYRSFERIRPRAGHLR